MKIKIKDLPKYINLVGKKLYIPKSHRPDSCKTLSKMIIRSGWNKGFWCVRKQDDDRVYPINFNNFNEIKEWYIE